MLSSMSAHIAQDNVLNFVVTGEVRSGAGVVQSCLNRTPSTVCHGGLLFDHSGTPQEQDVARRESHESYFGACNNPKLREWFVAGESNPVQYLNDRVFDNPQQSEDRVGVRLTYSQLHRYELYDLLDERWREGDFCLIHVLRNPISCLLSLRQAQKTGVWCEHASSPAQLNSYSPPPISLDLQEVTDYVRWHEAIRGKAHVSCRDALEITYRDVSLNFKRTMQRVFDFLELPQQDIPLPLYRRLPNKDVRSRIGNYAQLLRELPGSVREYLREDLF